jgi:hypothetical protein
MGLAQLVVGGVGEALLEQMCVAQTASTTAS